MKERDSGLGIREEKIFTTNKNEQEKVDKVQKVEIVEIV